MNICPWDSQARGYWEWIYHALLPQENFHKTQELNWDTTIAGRFFLSWATDRILNNFRDKLRGRENPAWEKRQAEANATTDSCCWHQPCCDFQDSWGSESQLSVWRAGLLQGDFPLQCGLWATVLHKESAPQATAACKNRRLVRKEGLQEKRLLFPDLMLDDETIVLWLP